MIDIYKNQWRYGVEEFLGLMKNIGLSNKDALDRANREIDMAEKDLKRYKSEFDTHIMLLTKCNLQLFVIMRELYSDLTNIAERRLIVFNTIVKKHLTSNQRIAKNFTLFA